MSEKERILRFPATSFMDIDVPIMRDKESITKAQYVFKGFSQAVVVDDSGKLVGIAARDKLQERLTMGKGIGDIQLREITIGAVPTVGSNDNLNSVIGVFKGRKDLEVVPVINQMGEFRGAISRNSVANQLNRMIE